MERHGAVRLRPGTPVAHHVRDLVMYDGEIAVRIVLGAVVPVVEQVRAIRARRDRLVVVAAELIALRLRHWDGSQHHDATYAFGVARGDLRRQARSRVVAIQMELFDL